MIEEFGISQRNEGPDPGKHGYADGFDTAQKRFEDAQVEHGLGDDEFGTRFDFIFESSQFFLEVDGTRVGADADEKAGGFADGVAGDIQAVIESPQQVGQADGVDIVDSGGIGVIAEFGGVAGDGEDIANTEGPSSQQVALHTDDVSVATGVVKEHFDIDIALNEDGEGQGGHARACSGTIGDIDRINAMVGELSCLFEHAFGVDTFG